MGLGERAKPSNSSVSTTRIRPLSGPHWPWMLLQALSALRSGPRLQHLVQLHIRTDCGPQGHQLKNPSTVVHAQFARLQLSQWDRHRGTQCASVRWSSAKCALSPSHPVYSISCMIVSLYVSIAGPSTACSTCASTQVCASSLILELVLAMNSAPFSRMVHDY